MRTGLALLFALMTSPVFAVGSDDDTPPTPSETTTTCEGDQVFDETTETCVPADAKTLTDTTRYNAVRELAYDGAYDRALAVIAAADNPDDPGFLNYRGFIHRQQGNMKLAIMFYAKALAIDPDYHLARSYLGQGLVAQGDIAGARAQLKEIAARGGRHGWPHRALSMSINAPLGNGSY